MMLKISTILFFLSVSFFTSAGGTDEQSKTTFNIQDYKGQLVYLDFWASWCSVCKQSFPWMSELQKRYPGKLKVVAVNLDEDIQDAKDFLQKVPVSFEVVFDPQGTIANQYKLLGLPSAFIFDQQGKLVYQHSGFRKYDDVKLEKKIQTLIR